MSEAFIQVPPQSTGLKVRTEEVVSGANTVEMEVTVLGDPVTVANLANVTAAGALKTDSSATTQPVSGTVTANIGTTGGLALDTTVSSVQPRRIQDGAGATLATVTAGNALKVDGSAVTQPVSGTVTANQGTAAVASSKWPIEIVDSGGVNIAAVSASNALKIDGSAVTQPVSGTVTANQGGAPWTVKPDGTAWALTGTSANVDVTNTVTVSGTVTANAGTGNFNENLAQVNGSTVVTATTGVQLVGIEGRAGTSLETTAGVLDENLKNVGNAAVVTAASGVQKVGIVGNAAATLDSTIGAATAPTNALATSDVYQTTIPALTAGQAVAAQCDTTGSQYVSTEGRKKTYSSEVSGTGVTGINVSLPGNGTTTVKVTRVEVSLSTSGTAGIQTVSLIRTTAAPTGGTPSSMTVVPHDTNFAGASSTPQSWFGGAPTGGTGGGSIRGVQFFDESSTVTGANTWLWTFGGERNTSPLVLRGTGQVLEINLGGVIATQTLVASIEWEEDNS